MRPEPTNPLPASARSMWIYEDAIGAVIVVAIAFGIAAVAGALMPWLPLATTVLCVAYVAAIPRKRYRRYRWELHEEELDLVDGVYEVVRTIVPLTRIQHVSVERTGWTDLFHLVRLHVHTAAGTTTIPGLERAQADDARDRILARLRTPDDL